MIIEDSPELILEGPRATIRFRRVSEHNRIDPCDLEVLVEHFRRVVDDPYARVLVVTGAGEKTFSSGYTIEAIRESLDDRFERMLDMLESLPLPVICALNGSVYGGATDLALCCDFRIGVTPSRMFMPAAKFALHYYPGGMRRYVSRLGLTAAKKLFLTAQTIEAEEMLRIGFLTELVERRDLEAMVDRYVKATIECERNVVASMKRQLDRVASGDRSDPEYRAAYQGSLRSDELTRRVAAHLKA